jgi:hypothetical protein
MMVYRLAIPKKESWMILLVDFNLLLSKYSSQHGQPGHRFKCIKKVQLCSSMLLRDLVTSDQLLDPIRLPKELAIKIDSRKKLKMAVVDVVNQCKDIMPDASSEKMLLEGDRPAETRASHPTEAMLTPSKSSLSVSPKSQLKSGSRLSSTPLNFPGYGSNGMASPATEFKAVPSLLPHQATPDFAASTAANNSSSAIFRTIVPDTPAHERVLALSHMLHYSGTQALLLYEGKMIVQFSGRLIVLTDVENSVEGNPGIVNQGLWRAFAKGLADSAATPAGAYRQAFLKGHSDCISFLEVPFKLVLEVSVLLTSFSDVCQCSLHGYM